MQNERRARQGATAASVESRRRKRGCPMRVPTRFFPFWLFGTIVPNSPCMGSRRRSDIAAQAEAKPARLERQTRAWDAQRPAFAPRADPFRIAALRHDATLPSTMPECVDRGSAVRSTSQRHTARRRRRRGGGSRDVVVPLPGNSRVRRLHRGSDAGVAIEAPIARLLPPFRRPAKARGCGGPGRGGGIRPGAPRTARGTFRY